MQCYLCCLSKFHQKEKRIQVNKERTAIFAAVALFVSVNYLGLDKSCKMYKAFQ